MANFKSAIKVTDNDANCCTIEIEDEDHTLGNSLRYMITKSPHVHFCGYSIPHPNERKLVLQIQTYKNTITPLEALREGLENLQNMCSHIKSTFETELGITKDEQME